MGAGRRPLKRRPPVGVDRALGGGAAGCEGRWGWWGREATRAERSNGSGHATTLPCQWRAWPRSMVRTICSVLKRLVMLTRVRRGGKGVWAFWGLGVWLAAAPGAGDWIAVCRGTRQESKPWAGERRYPEYSGIRRGALITVPATRHRVDKRSTVHQRRRGIRWTTLALVHPLISYGRNDDQGPARPHRGRRPLPTG